MLLYILSVLFILFPFSECEELVLHFVFEVEFFGGVEGALDADELGVGMRQEVVDGLVVEGGIDGDIGGLDAVGGFVHPVLSKPRLQLQHIVN